jgi:hypothetical protein
MAQSLAFTDGETFAPRSRIMFGSLNFLGSAISELCLTDLDTPVIIGVGPIVNHLDPLVMFW